MAKGAVHNNLGGTSSVQPEFLIDSNPSASASKNPLPPHTSQNPSLSSAEFKKFISNPENLKRFNIDAHGQRSIDPGEAWKKLCLQMPKLWKTLEIKNGVPVDSPENLQKIVRFLESNTELPLYSPALQKSLMVQLVLIHPDKVLASLGKMNDLTKISYAIRLDAVALLQQGKVEEGARLLHYASYLNPQDSSLHFETANAYKSWADKEQDAKVKKHLLGEALGHLNAQLPLDPSYWRALKLKGDILQILGKSLEAAKCHEEALHFATQEFNRALDQFSKVAYEKALGESALRELQILINEIQAIPTDKASLKFQKLLCLKNYQEAAWLLEKHHPPLGISSNSPEYKSYEAHLKELKGKMLETHQAIFTLCEELRASLTLPSGASSSLDQVEGARVLVEIDQQLRNLNLDHEQQEKVNTALAQDLDTWTQLLNALPREAMPRAELVNEYASLLKEYLSLRDQVSDPFRPSAFALNANAITSKMRELKDRLLERADYITTKGSHEYLSELLDRVIDLNDQGLLSSLNAQGFQDYSQVCAANSQKFEQALQIKDVKEKRTALLEVLSEFVKLRSERSLDSVMRALEDTLKASPDTEKIQIYMAIHGVLQGSGLSGEAHVKALGQATAERLMSSAKTETNKAQSAKNLLLAKAYFDSIQDKAKASSLEADFNKLRASFILSLAQGKLDSAKRLELLSLCIQIDQASLPQKMEELLKDSDQKKAFAEKIAGELAFYRAQLSKIEAQDLKTRLEKTSELASLASLYFSLTQGKEALLNGEKLRPVIEALEQDLGSVFEELLAQKEGSSEAQKNLAARVITDLKSKTHSSFFEAKAEWFNHVSLDSVAEFAEYSQAAHLLALQAKESSGKKSIELYEKAAILFSQLGLKDRVLEALSPALEEAKKLPEALPKARLLLEVANLYQQAGMKEAANKVFDELTLLDVPGVPKVLHESIQIAQAFKQMNLGNLDQAKKLLESIPDNPQAKLLLENIEAGQKQYRTAMQLNVLRAAVLSYYEDRKGAEAQAAKDNLEEVSNLVISGKYSVYEAARAKFGFFLLETGPGWQVNSYLDLDPALSDQQFAEQSYKLAEMMVKENHYVSASQIAQLLTENNEVGEKAKTLLAEKIPEKAKWEAIKKGGRGLLYFTPLAPAMAFLDVSSPSTIGEESSEMHALQSVKGVAFDAATALVPFAAARWARAGVEAAFVTRAATLIESPLALKLAGFTVGTTTEAAAFTFSNMTLQSLSSLSVDHWRLKNFGREFGSIWVTFMLLHGVNLSMQQAGRAAENISWMKAAPGEAAKLKEAGKLALSRGGERVFSAASWGMRVTSFAGAEAFNEKIGLKDEENVPLWMRFISSAITDAQMIKAGRVIDVVTGGRISELEQQTQLKYKMHELLHRPQLQKASEEIPAPPVAAAARSVHADPLLAKPGLEMAKEAKGEKVYELKPEHILHPVEEGDILAEVDLGRWQGAEGQIRRLLNIIMKGRELSTDEKAILLDDLETQAGKIYGADPAKAYEGMIEVLTSYRDLGLEEGFSRSEITQLLSLLYLRNAPPVISKARLEALKEIPDMTMRRKEFLKALLQRETSTPTQARGQTKGGDFNILKAEADRVAAADAILTEPWAKEALKEIQAEEAASPALPLRMAARGSDSPLVLPQQENPGVDPSQARGGGVLPGMIAVLGFGAAMLYGSDAHAALHDAVRTAGEQGSGLFAMAGIFGGFGVFKGLSNLLSGGGENPALPPRAVSGMLPPPGKIHSIIPHADGHDFTIGRSGSSDLVFRDANVSRVHCTIQYRPGEGWFLIDGATGSPLKSHYGILLNGKKVTEKSSPLHEGDAIAIHLSTFIFHAPAELPSPPVLPSQTRVEMPPLRNESIPWLPDAQGNYVSLLGRPSTKAGSINPANLLPINDRVVSRQHAEIIAMPDGKRYLRDLSHQGSANVGAHGTWVQEGEQWRKLNPQEKYELAAGQSFALGSVLMSSSKKYGTVSTTFNLDDALVYTLGDNGNFLITNSQPYTSGPLKAPLIAGRSGKQNPVVALPNSGAASAQPLSAAPARHPTSLPQTEAASRSEKIPWKSEPEGNYVAILGRPRTKGALNPPHLFPIDDRVVSREHSEITVSPDGRRWLRDLSHQGSMNVGSHGTWVQEGNQWRKLAVNERYELTPGQSFALGSVVLSTPKKGQAPQVHLEDALVYTLSQDGNHLETRSQPYNSHPPQASPAPAKLFELRVPQPFKGGEKTFPEYTIGNISSPDAYFHLEDGSSTPQVYAAIRPNNFGEWVLFNGRPGGRFFREGGVELLRKGTNEREVVNTPTQIKEGDEVIIKVAKTPQNPTGEIRQIFREPVVQSTQASHLAARSGRQNPLMARPSPRREMPQALPAIPLHLKRPPLVDAQGPSFGAIYGGIEQEGHGKLLPQDGSVIKFAKFMSIRYNLDEKHYEYKLENQDWQALLPGTVISGPYRREYVFLELKGYPRQGIQGVDQIHQLSAQLAFGLAESGTRAHLEALQKEGKNVTAIDAYNVAEFSKPAFDEALRSYDSGDLGRTQGGIFGGSSTVQAWIDPQSGQLLAFCARKTKAAPHTYDERWSVQKNPQDGRYYWAERNRGINLSEPVDTQGLPPNATLISIDYQRMTGRIFVDKKSIPPHVLSGEAMARLENIRGLFVRPGAALTQALLTVPKK